MQRPRRSFSAAFKLCVVREIERPDLRVDHLVDDLLLLGLVSVLIVSAVMNVPWLVPSVIGAFGVRSLIIRLKQ